MALNVMYSQKYNIKIICLQSSRTIICFFFLAGVGRRNFEKSTKVSSIPHTTIAILFDSTTLDSAARNLLASIVGGEEPLSSKYVIFSKRSSRDQREPI